MPHGLTRARVRADGSGPRSLRSTRAACSSVLHAPARRARTSWKGMAPLIFSVCTEPSETTPRHFVVLNVPCLQSAKTTAEIRIGIGRRMLNSRKAAPDTHSMMTHTSLAHTSSAHRQRARGGGSEAVEIDQRQQVLALQGVFGVSSQFQGPGTGTGTFTIPVCPLHVVSPRDLWSCFLPRWH